MHYLTTNCQSHAAYRDNGLDLRRQVFCMTVGQNYLDNTPMIFMDETTVRLDMQLKKCWQSRTKRLMLPTTTYPREVVTLYGSVSNATKAPIMWYMSTSTNAVDFLKFCRQIRKNLKPQYANMPVTLVLDNHSAHDCAWSLRRLGWKTARLLPVFTPDNSSYLNPAEFIWSNLKRNFRYKLAELRIAQRDLRRPDLIRLAEEAM